MYAFIASCSIDPMIGGPARPGKSLRGADVKIFEADARTGLRRAGRTAA
jgi:hypothetical protein